MEESIEVFLVWYEKNRGAFVKDFYLRKDQRGWFDDWRFPFVDWDRALLLKNEMSFSVKALAKLRELFAKTEPKQLENDLLLAILALKSRIEYISTAVEIFPAFAAACASVFGALAVYGNLEWKLMFTLCGVSVVILFFWYRLKVRRALSRYRELINILETYKQQIMD